MLKLKQVESKIHQLYNRRIAKLIDAGYRVYVTAYLPAGSLEVKYRVSVSSLLEAQLFSEGCYVLDIIRFKLGQTKPRSYWGAVELMTMQALQHNSFIQYMHQLASYK